MELSDLHKVILNLVTTVAWALGILITVVAVYKGKRMKDQMGVSFKTYLALAGATEIIYSVSAVMILSAMGINVMQHLANLEFWKFYQIVSQFNLATVQIIGYLGWVGFVINRTVSFISPGYLLIRGGRRLPSYFFYSAWTEVTLEIFTTILVFTTLKIG